MAKVTEFQWQIPVPEVLQKGAVFDRWDEVSLHSNLSVSGFFSLLVTKFKCYLFLFASVIFCDKIFFFKDQYQI